jgi:peptide deformylase
VSDLVCELVKEDDPFLREIPEVFDFDNPQVDSEKLVDQIKENMIHHRGVGLSANQIGIPLKVFGFLFDDKITVTFNQEILEWSEETIYMREGCLSVQFQAFDGEEQAGSLTGLSSIVYQHEMEHMNGDLFIQGASKYKLKQAMKKRDKYLNKINKQEKE